MRSASKPPSPAFRVFHRVEADGMVYRIVQAFGVEIVRGSTGVRWQPAVRGHYGDQKVR